MNNRDDRKKQLIAQGALYRAELLLAKQELQTSLQPRALANNVLRHGMQVVLGTIRASSAAAASRPGLQSLLPLLMTSISLLSRRKPLLKSLAPLAAIAAAGSGLAIAVSRYRQRHTRGSE